jgi:type II secretory pathway pseudopilin PulG
MKLEWWMLINITKNLKHKMKSSGQSVIEIIVAVAIFTIIAASAVVTILGSFSTSRLAKEESIAMNLAVEGIEASQSIRNQDWEGLIDGDHGISKNGSWLFSGTEDVVGKYTRFVNVTEIDNDTKEATSNVTWDFSSSRRNSVELTTRLTSWQTASGQLISGTPLIDSCNDYCIVNAYSLGVCRRNTGACSDNGETYESGGDQYCTGGPNEDTCCCAP